MKLQLATNPSKNRVASQFTFQTTPDLNRMRTLTKTDKEEVLSFLKIRPVHTVVMTSFIRDNGMENTDNRGKFYGYRSLAGKLEGVALIGHTTLIEARSDDSLTAFAVVARQSETPIHIMMADGKTIETFWRHFTGDNRPARKVCTELLFELNFPFFVQNCDWDVRVANADELEQIAVAHDEVAFIESGVSPLLKDRAGFLKRCLKRIEKGRTFVVFENGKLIFKADIVAETSDVVYLEGIYVAPEYRGKGIGSSCLSKLGQQLLEKVENVCLLTNVEFTGAHRSFVKAGFKNTDCCQTIFV
ncbi:MAG: GNAT family N-acetyltransferase [Pyrinomonadaceae bacterium]|nr:GNAT family N-acetyltransferase [Pyrinomonadaceae bacterium]